jgi:hypothetical protein
MPDTMRGRRIDALAAESGAMPMAVEFMNNLVVGIGCIGVLMFPAGPTRWRLPATIEALHDVPAQSVQGSQQLRGVLYVSGGRSFTIAKGQRFSMVKVYDEGECRIKFENTEYDVSSCPWLDGFRDHQEDVFKVVSGRQGGELPAVATADAVGQNWEQADATTVRLKPAAFADLSPPVRESLERRGCVVPQSYSNKIPHNVVRGRFTSRTELDIAVLCSRNRASSILVFRGGSTAAVTELAQRPDANFLQVVGPGGLVGYSRALAIAEPKYILEHQRQEGSTVTLPDHDGINDIFLEKASVVWYWSGGRWLQLSGAD